MFFKFFFSCTRKNTGFVKVWEKLSLSNKLVGHNTRLIFASWCSGIASRGNARVGLPSLASCSWSLILGLGQLEELF